MAGGFPRESCKGLAIGASALKSFIGLHLRKLSLASSGKFGEHFIRDSHIHIAQVF